jgi:hypothetical protein
MTAIDVLPPAAAAVSSGLTRPRLFACVIVLLLANAAAAQAVHAAATVGPTAALVGGLGHSWAFWVACACTVRLALSAAPAPATPRDRWLAAGSAAAALVPLSPVAAVAGSVLALALLTDRTVAPQLKAAGWVLAAVSVQLFWSRLAMMFFVRPIATADAHLVSLVINRPVVGYSVEFAHGGHMLSILGPCTSVQNASIALMLYVAVVRSFRPIPRRSELLALAGVFLTVVGINIGRLALMAQSMEMYHLVHGANGAAVVNGVITTAGLGWAAASVRHEIFR